jgi:integrase
MSATDIEREARPGGWDVSVNLLRAVIDGSTYDAAAAQFGITRTAVERRVKAAAARLVREVGVDGLNLGATAFVTRLRERRDEIIRALDRFEPNLRRAVSKGERIIAQEDIARAAMRIRGRSAMPARDLALFYILFTTGARPLEIARLRVRDYLTEDGAVRETSELPSEASITGRPRPLYFCSTKLDEALSAYLGERIGRGQGTTEETSYRGLDPSSQLFLTPSGEPFRITTYGEPGQRRSLCRPILETYRKLFRYAEFEGTTALSARHTVVARLYDRGADEEQVGLMLGISDRSAVRELFPRTRRDMVELVAELI